MYELIWFVGGALTYQFLSRILKITQLYLFFQEIHVHALLMLKAASEDLETAMEIKSNLVKECDLKEKEIELIGLADKEAIKLWKQSVVVNLQQCVPSAFKTSIQYSTWAGLTRYLKKVKINKNDVR